MKRSPGFHALLLAVAGLLVTGCAAMRAHEGYGPFSPPTFQSDRYVPKVDNFAVVLDASSSMDECAPDGHTRFAQAKAFLERMNKTLPELEMKGVLRSFGHSPQLSGKLTKQFYGLEDYSRAGFQQALDRVAPAGGTTPMRTAVSAVAGDLAEAAGPIAVIVVSDGLATGQSPVAAARALKEQFGERLCIYTVQIGDDPEGRATLEAIAAAGECGFTRSAAEIMNADGMAGFVEAVFLTRLLDSDGDGVYDNRDKCPDTPKGVAVDADGCPPKSEATAVPEPMDQKAPVKPGDHWVLNDVLFDFDRAVIKPSAAGPLDEVIRILKENPGLRVSLEGHTDSVGTAAYNMGLSVRRADAVKRYMIEKGIDAGRLVTKGYGLTKPVASNQTKDGRAQNRRVEIHPIR